MERKFSSLNFLTSNRKKAKALCKQINDGPYEYKNIDSRQVFSKNRDEYSSNFISLNYNCKLSYVKSMIQELNKFARKSGTKMALFSRAWVESPFRRPKINTLHEPRVEQRQGVPKMNIKLPKRVLKILLTRPRVGSLQQHVVCFQSDPGELCYRPKFLYMKELKKS